MPQLVCIQAARARQGNAVEFGSERISYPELVAGAGKIAACLQADGAGRDEVVAVWVDRSPAMVYAALGVLCAGAAYLPLDPGLPPLRVKEILRDAEAQLVLTDAAHLQDLERAPCTALLLEELLSAPEAASDPAGLADSLAAPELSDLAYVVYTSGSSGRLKGVDITHGNLLNLVRWHRTAFAVDENDRACAIASPGFDASAWELWPYLTAGATIAIPDEETRLSPEALRAWLIDERVTICFLPTVLAARAATQEWPEHTSLRTMLTGGDVLHVYPRPDLPFALVNNYGPSECTVVTTSGVITGSARAGELPSIGWPITNVQVHLLDDEQRPVAVGAVGEIYVGGKGVARGYRNDPLLTAERFIADPFSGHAEARLHRTGDLARYRDDGALEFCGRADAQVQIRGNRVEPDEVAFHLDQHPDVRTSCVVAVLDDAGEPRLATYFVASSANVPTAAALAVFLRERLPRYMVPASFEPLAVLPLTPNGKVDRNAVAALYEAVHARELGPSPAEPAGRSTEASSAIESRLAELVGSLLSVEDIGPEDDFFLLGGHSLLAAQLIARIREAFGAELSLRTIFDHPTLRELARAIEHS